MSKPFFSTGIPTSPLNPPSIWLTGPDADQLLIAIIRLREILGMDDGIGAVAIAAADALERVYGPDSQFHDDVLNGLDNALGDSRGF